MASFGDLLRTYRLRSFTSGKTRALSQEQFAELLAEAIDIEGISGSTISNWERGKYQIHKDDRRILVGLIKVFYQCGGITSAAIANEFLLSGNFRPLNQNELLEVNPAWLDEVTPPTTSPVSAPGKSDDFFIPPPSYTRLFGVDEIVNLMCEKLSSPTPPWIVSLVGLGGLGKSAVANAVARRLTQEKRFDHVIWLSVSDFWNPQLDGSVEVMSDSWTLALGKRLLPHNLNLDDSRKRREQVRNQLQRFSHLIVFDNIENERQMGFVLDQISGMADPAKFLLTSRQHPPPDADVFVWSLGGLNTKDAVSLLKHQAKIIGVDFSHFLDAELQKVCDLVGGHPLALRLTPKLTLMHSLPQVEASLHEGQAGLGRVYHLIYEKLWQTLTDEEKQLLQTMLWSASPGSPAKHLIAISGFSEQQFWSVMTRLIEQCLIELRGNLHERRYGIHSLTEQFLHSPRASVSNVAESDSVMTAKNIAYWKAFLDSITESSWDQLDSDYQNVYHAVQLSLKLSVEEQTPALKENLLHLSRHLIKFAERRGYWRGWMPILEALISQFESQPVYQCELINQLGDLYRYSRQFSQATATHRRAENLAREEGLEETLAHTCVNLGLDYLRNGAYDEAERPAHEALSLFTKLNLTGKELGGTLNLLGLISLARGNFSSAENHLTQSVNIWQKLEQPIEQVRALNNLAIVFQNQKLYDQALQCFQEAKLITEDLASELDYIVIALSEGSLYFELGEIEKAETVFGRINLSYLRQSGHMFYEALALNNIGNVCLAQNKLTQAIDQLQQSVLLWEQLGEELRLANTLKVLGDASVKIDDRKSASRIYERAVDIVKNFPGNRQAQGLYRELEQARSTMPMIDRTKRADQVDA